MRPWAKVRTCLELPSNDAIRRPAQSLIADSQKDLDERNWPIGNLNQALSPAIAAAPGFSVE